jgi:hypothetical protein
VLLLWWSPAGQQSRLVWVEHQAEAPEPFPEDRQPPSRLVLALKADDAVVTPRFKGVWQRMENFSVKAAVSKA